jgi:integrase
LKPGHLCHLLCHPLHTSYALPSGKKAGADAAYWIPILGLYSGARISELVQLQRCDFEQAGDVHLMKITNEGDDQSVKTAASVRKFHCAQSSFGWVLPSICSAPAVGPTPPCGPSCPGVKGKRGGFFSQWFGTYRRSLGLGTYPDFHCFRHTVRSALANAEVAEPLIDMLLGHEAKGSMGARVYTHRTVAQVRASVEKITFPNLLLPRVLPSFSGLSAETAQRP